MKLKTLFAGALCSLCLWAVSIPEASAQRRPRPNKAPKEAKADTIPAFHGEAVLFTDYMPLYRNKGVESYAAWVNEQIVYPSDAKQAGIEGTVAVSFVVTKEGKIAGVEILRSPDESLSREALRVIRLSRNTTWKPGLDKDGNPVDVRQTIGVKFAR